LGVYVADLPTGELAAGTRISFTIYWPTSGNWEGSDFAVQVALSHESLNVADAG
jgi:glucoamylase